MFKEGIHIFVGGILQCFLRFSLPSYKFYDTKRGSTTKIKSGSIRMLEERLVRKRFSIIVGHFF